MNPLIFDNYNIAWLYISSLVGSLNYEDFVALLNPQNFVFESLVNGNPIPPLNYGSFIEIMKTQSFDNIESTFDTHISIDPSMYPEYAVKIDLRCFQKRKGIGFQETRSGYYAIDTRILLKIENGLIISVYQPLYTKTYCG